MVAGNELTLAFGGGGAKSFAHIGVLSAAEEAGFTIRGIAGTSGGALIAALYACGMDTEAMLQLAESIDFKELTRKGSRKADALYSADQWRNFYESLFGKRTFSDLHIPVAFPVTDLDHNRELCLTSGPIVESLLAATAIPGIFPPHQSGSRLFVDGGVVNPVPVAAARRLAPTARTIAVALMPPVEEWPNHPFPQLLHSVPALRPLYRLRFTRALAIFIRSSDLTNRRLAELRMHSENPDAVVRPQVNHLGLFDKVDVRAVAAAGKRAALEVFRDIDA